MKETVTIELLKIHSSFRIEFYLLFSNDENKNYKYSQDTLNKFTISGGNIFLKINPVAYILIDIQSRKDKKDFFNPFGTFPLNKKLTFILLQKLKRLYRKIRDPNLEMFYLDEGKLLVNKEEAEKAEEILIFESTTSVNKEMHIFPFVVEDDSQRYEGVYIYINNISNGSSITFTELEMVIDTLQKIDFSILSLKLINTYLLMKNEETREVEFHKKPLTESEEAIIQGESVNKIQDENKMPDI